MKPNQRRKLLKDYISENNLRNIDIVTQLERYGISLSTVNSWTSGARNIPLIYLDQLGVTKQ